MNYEPTFLDVETTTHNKGHRFDPRNSLVSYVINDKFYYYNDPNFREGKPKTPGLVVGFNVKFDLHWMDYPLDDISIWDCQLAEFVLRGQNKPYLSLNETLEEYGLPTKKSNEVHALWEAGVQTDEISVPTLKEYNLQDVAVLPELYNIQQQRCTPLQKKLILLLGEDMKVLIAMERNGILFDKEGAQRKINELKGSLEKLNEELSSFLPTIEHGEFNWDSGDHLSALLYGGSIVFPWALETPSTYKTGDKKGQDYIKRSWHSDTVVFPQHFIPLENTEVKKTKDNLPTQAHFYQVDEPTIKQLSTRSKESKRLISLLLRRGKDIKLVEMLESLFKQFEKMNWENNLIHPNYNQAVVVTGRLSSSAP